MALCATSAPALAEGETTSATFYVPATAGGGTEILGGAPWFETGLMLQPGTTIAVSVSGFWKSCNPHTCITTADGIGVKHVRDCNFIASDLSTFSLIAQTGKQAPVFVGIGPTTIKGGGKLRFAINDCYFGDNEGGFNVTVTYPTGAAAMNPDDEPAE